MLNRRSGAMLVAALVLAGCATPTPTRPVRQAQPNDATIYIYRPSSLALGARDAYISVNGLEVAPLANGSYFVLRVPEGAYVIEQKWAWDIQMGKAPLKLPALELKKQQKRYLRFSTEAGRRYVYNGISLDYGIEEVSETIALSETGAGQLKQVGAAP